MINGDIHSSRGSRPSAKKDAGVSDFKKSLKDGPDKKQIGPRTIGVEHPLNRKSVTADFNLDGKPEKLTFTLSEREDTHEYNFFGAKFSRPEKVLVIEGRDEKGSLYCYTHLDELRGYTVRADVDGDGDLDTLKFDLGTSKVGLPEMDISAEFQAHDRKKPVSNNADIQAMNPSYPLSKDIPSDIKSFFTRDGRNGLDVSVQGFADTDRDGTLDARVDWTVKYYSKGWTASLFEEHVDVHFSRDDIKMYYPSHGLHTSTSSPTSE